MTSGGASGGSAALRAPGGAGGEPAAEGGVSVGDAGGAAGAPPAVDCECLTSTVSWRADGGLVFNVPMSFAEPCRAFRHELRELGGPPVESCAAPLPSGCDAALGVRDINQALQHPDVQAALLAAPVLYGGDPRPLDGQVQHIEVDGKVIEIGLSCDDPQCAIPPGVASFGYILGVIEKRELDTDCQLPE
jgi:hypothetical protein